YMLHNTLQLKATEMAPESRGSALALYSSGWALGQSAGVAAMSLAISLVGYRSSAIAAAVGDLLLGLWMRGNLGRLCYDLADENAAVRGLRAGSRCRPRRRRLDLGEGGRRARSLRGLPDRGRERRSPGDRAERVQGLHARPAALRREDGGDLRRH